MADQIFAAGPSPRRSASNPRVLAFNWLSHSILALIVQLDGAFEYLSKVGAEPIEGAAFETAAGIGVSVTAEDVAAGVAATVEAVKEQLLEER